MTYMLLSVQLLKELLFQSFYLERYMFSVVSGCTEFLISSIWLLHLFLYLQSKNALLSTFLFLDQIVWLGRTGIYKNKERAELLGRISLFCWMGSSVCTTLVELAELGRLSKSMKKLEKDIKGGDKYQNEQYRDKLQTSNDRTLALVKASMDVVVAVGLLQLAPKKVTPRVTGGFGFVSSLISCYQLLPSPPKAKTP
ncbi:hypothetical protein AQUCO_01300420v1 [Aquilegia coerulea]|uniref:Peroxisomal membrane protein 11C n=1 Tax=Aquilegia coerulea TaxID=218851 RepID=A0A2G5E1I5_AQUCA|nr:hypothetical protein AQUCO_01300420v1 [Aquilegia coerulea]